MLTRGVSALDQLFPHELAHVLLSQFTGPRRPGGSTQVHAIGVRTDPETALNEGFAEHLQVMAMMTLMLSRILHCSLPMPILHAFHVSRAQDIYTVISAYRAEFPGEARSVDAIVDEITAGQGFQPAPQIWMANPDFPVGTSVFDQFRVIPRPHTFDLNAASMLDLLTIPGVTKEVASAILEDSPYSAIQDLLRVTCVKSELIACLVQMAANADSTRTDPESTEMALLENFETILRSFPGH